VLAVKPLPGPLPGSAPPPSPASGGVRSKAVQADPERARALAEQGTEATLRGDFATAVAGFQRAIMADANYAPAWRGKALALEQLGRNGEAIAAFRQFLKLSPTGVAADKIRARLRALESK
jgi:DnaJ family protein C protein 7